jgi:predicted dinucleotide-binding enzyme
MKIAVLGAGSVGGTLGRRFAEIGHHVAFGVPSPDAAKYRDLVASIPGVEIATVGEASRDADAVVLAVPWDAVPGALEEAGNLAGRLVVDCTNPLAFEVGTLRLAVGFETSGGELVAAWSRGARVVKCFNTTGFANMGEPAVEGRRSAMFVCGDDAGARETVRRLAEEIGFDAVDAGEMTAARLLEPLAMLWIHLAMTTPLGRDFAFGILRR